MTEREFAEQIGVDYVGQIDGRREGEKMPLYAMHGFINTKEGWNLMACCRRNGDMKPYEQARAAFDAAQRR